MLLHLHDKYLNNCVIMFLHGETSYAWIGHLAFGHGHVFTTFLLKMFALELMAAPFHYIQNFQSPSQLFFLAHV